MKRWSTAIRGIQFAIVLAIGLVMQPSVVGAESDTDPLSAEAQELANRYAPIVMLKAQEEACDAKGEPYAPTSVNIVLDNPEVLLRQWGNGNPVVKTAPSAADIYGLGQGFFLDFPGSSLEPGCIYERDFNKYAADDTATVYAHIVQQTDEPDKLALQYWFYWYYNDWNNKHESDWEGIQLLFEASSIEEALKSEPISVGYAQHEGGEEAEWGAEKLEREGTHPVVYPSAGSHASYYSSALYLGRGASEGFGCDTTDGPSERVDPEVVLLPDGIDDPEDPLAWLAYEGRWGEQQRGAFNGPTGPLAKDRWLRPIAWHEELRPNGVVIPGGDSQGEVIITTFCDVVESGSGLLIKATTSPVTLLLMAGLAILAGRWLIGLTDWSLVKPLPIRGQRRAGQIVRAAPRLLMRSKSAWSFGLIYLPMAVVVGALTRVLASLPIIRGMLDLAGSTSGFGLALALLAGGFANVAAFAVVNAMVSAHFGLDKPAGLRPSARETTRLVWERRRAFIRTFGRASVIVIALLLTAIGVPFAIRQIVRYQFLPHVVMNEDLSAHDALARSSELVKGRWWHTALTTGLTNALVAGSGLVVGLLMLVLFAELPLWLFSSMVTLVYALFAPLAGIAQTLLFGDATAELESVGEAKPALVKS